MKIYIAAIWSRRDEMRLAETRLTMAGHKSTARWLWTTSPNLPEFWRPEAQIDLEDIDEADVLLTFTQPLGSSNPGGGRHFELGYAAARGKKIIGVGEREIIFHHLPQIVFVQSIEEALKALKALEDGAVSPAAA